MGWRDIIRSPDPSRALYLAMRANPTASQAADTFQGGFEGAMEGLGNVGHVFTAPARALAAGAARLGGANVDVMDYTMHGAPEGASLQYGDLLADTMEQSGELAPGGTASKLVRLAGNIITDPGAAATMLTGADAAAALAGSGGPAVSPLPTVARFPRASAPRGPSAAPMPAGPPAAAPPAGPRGGNPMRPAPMPRTPRPRGPAGPAMVAGDQTQAVPVGPAPPPGRFGVAGDVQPTPRFSTAGEGWYNPTQTQAVPVSPTDTQRVPMVGRGNKMRPRKARGKAKAKAKEKAKEE